MKLIQGFFVQQTTGIDIGYAPIEGAVALMQRGLFPFMYAGAFYKDGSDAWTGGMFDPQGSSQLSEIVISESEVRFRKQYDRHVRLGPKTSILYVLDKREGNTWVGKWRHLPSQGGAWGPTRCIITEVDAHLFQEDITSFLKEKRGDFNSTAVDRYRSRHGRGR